MIDNLSPLRDVINKHRLSAKKNLGQNFLLDLNITGKIARLAGTLDDHTIVEIGPGPGGLTRALLANNAKKVIAFEKDERTRPALNEISEAYEGRLDVQFQDALNSDIFDGIEQPIRIVANLPYNIGTELLVRWLTQAWRPRWASLTLMFQHEVAERITAKQGDKHWGRLAILANWRSRSEIVYKLPPTAFFPPPKVNSAVVNIVPTNPKIDVELNELETLTKHAFGQRRKMLRASLKSLAPDAEKRIKSAGIDPTRRAETVSIEEFGELVKAFR